MRHSISLCLFLIGATLFAQGPEVTSWLQNTTGTGTYYVEGNSTAIDNNVLYNCQLIEYSDDYVYVHTKGIPSYATGPFLDGNPSFSSDQDAIYRIQRNPVVASNPTATNPGNIGIFINGVSLFDWRDGVSWNPLTNDICGGPGNPPCPGGMMAEQDWNRDAIPAERAGFDCAKGHPAMGNYHHHQNPSAFDLDLQVVSDICNLYDADGLYAIDIDAHSPLIGFAYDGYPIYGAIGFANADGTGGTTRIKSSYALRDITSRTTHADGTVVDQGPDVGETYFLGYFQEDYEYIAHPEEEDFLDEHNGRFCVTPEYPEGTYAYFATVDENYNSTYPYIVGPTFYGETEAASVNSVDEDTEVYSPVGLSESFVNEVNITVFPNPSADLVAVQILSIVPSDIEVNVMDSQGKLVESSVIAAGQTIWYLDTQTLHSGVYFIQLSDGLAHVTRQVVVR